jgi:hypothetical protein
VVLLWSGTIIGSADGAHIEASASALLKAFFLNLGVIAGRVAFGLPEYSSLPSFLLLHIRGPSPKCPEWYGNKQNIIQNP